jgi:hypothetical protein
MEITGERKQRFVRCLNERWIHSLNRKQRKKLQRAGILETARRPERRETLLTAQLERIKRQQAGRKAPKEKQWKIRYPKPGMSVQIHCGQIVVGRERSEARLVHETVVEFVCISRQTARLIGVSASGREDIDRRADYINDRRNGRIGFRFHATGRFVALGEIPQYTKFQIHIVPVAAMPPLLSPTAFRYALLA